MKKTTLISVILAFLFSDLCFSQAKTNENSNGITTITKGLRFCEGSVKYGNSILVSNFGCKSLNPTNHEGKGYIVKIENDKCETLIPSDGTLNAPKGMAISKNHLFIADVGKVVAYNLSDLKSKAQTIMMPKGEIFVNDVVVIKNKAYISVTNTGNIYSLDISNPINLSSKELKLYANITGANGMVADKNRIFIASFASNGKPNDDNVIYKIDNLDNPRITKMTNKKGLFDGIAVDGDMLYFTDWTNMGIEFLNMKSKKMGRLNMHDKKISGPADISISHHILFLPNLPSSEVIEIKLK